MYLFRAAIILFVLLSLPLRANLGDAVDQCVKRYGAPYGPPEADPKSPFVKLGFIAPPYTLTIFLLDNKEVGARVAKLDKSAFTPAEMKTIMDDDSDPAAPWTPTTSSDPTCLQWSRTDKATVLYDKDKHMLIFTTAAMAEALRNPVPAPAANAAPTPPPHYAN